MRTTQVASILTLLALAPLAGCTRDAATDTTAGSAAPAAAVAAAPAAVAAPATYRVPIDGLPSLGNPHALVTLVEFTDYQCPYCRRADATVQKLRALYGDDLRVVIAERPLPMHERARPAALAALAASAQGRFEAMHARLFAGELDDATLASAAKDSGLDLARFEADRAQVAPGLLAQSDALATKLDVKGTPSFFVNGRSIVGAQTLETFRAVVDERLEAARALVKTGVRPDDVYAHAIANGAENVAAEEDDAPSCGKSCDGDHKASDVHAAADTVEEVPTARAPARGSAFAPITIVEFADYECPFSAKGEATLQAIEKAHSGEVRVVFKNLPLPMHEHARDMARAAIAADAQGRFWQMHDRMFAAAAKGSVDRPGLDKIAADLGLDVARFDRDLVDPATDAKIAADQQDADKLGVKGTPTFFVNGRRIAGAQPVERFEGAIARAK
jgi:protein-disulfide isomerase